MSSRWGTNATRRLASSIDPELGRRQSDRRAEERRLAGSVGPEQRHGGARAGSRGYVLERDRAAVADGQAVARRSPRSPLPAQRAAGAVDDDVVAPHRVAKPPGEALELLLQALVLERGHRAAAVADRVVVVLAAGDDGLVACAAVAELDPLDQAQLVQQVEGPIDAGEPDVASASRSRSAISCAERQQLCRASRDDGLPRAARAVACLLKRPWRSSAQFGLGRLAIAARLAAN